MLEPGGSTSQSHSFGNKSSELVLVDVLKGISVNIQNGRDEAEYVAGMSFLSGSYTCFDHNDQLDC